eukprot:390543-Alexandrium_andersonii.AAC.1
MEAKPEASRPVRDGCSSLIRSVGSSCGPGRAPEAGTASSRTTCSTLTTTAECDSPEVARRAKAELRESR